MNAQASPHQDMLARITREITATGDLGAVLNSAVTALVEQTGMAFARVWLYVSDHECDWCRTHPRPANALVPPGETGLHLCAAAGALADLDRPHHMLPLTASATPAIVAAMRTPIRTENILDDPSLGTSPVQAEVLRPIGAKGAAAYPLVFRGELLGLHWDGGAALDRR